MRLTAAHRLMLVVLAFAAYGPTLKLGFFWDDHVMIEANPHLRSWSWQELRHDFTTDVFDGHGDPYYRPAQTLLNRIDFTIWGLRPFGYHLTNFLGHVANTLVIVQLGLLLGLTGMAAFLAAGLFAVHPIVVEQLMIIAGRAEIFGLLMTLLALYFLLGDGRRRLWAGYGCFVLALLFKESAMVIPGLLLLGLWMQDRLRAQWPRIVPCLLILPAYWALRHAAVGGLNFPHNPMLVGQFFLMAFPRVLCSYLQLLVVPWNLHSHHLMPHLSHGWFLYLAGLAALTGLAFWRRARWAIFALVWFVLSLLPKTPIMIFGNFMLEHWAYPAYVGCFFLAGHLLAQAWDKPRALASRIAIPGYLTFLVFFALMVHLNVALRGTDEKMYRWALRFSSSNPVRYNLGVLLLQTGRPKEAIDYFEEVRAHYPKDAANLHALALAYWEAGHRKSARFHLRQLQLAHPQNQAIAQSLKKMDAELK